MSASFRKGLHEIGNGMYAYLQPNGGWGLANAGFIRDHNQSLLVDTLIDGRHTLELLKAIQDATGLRTQDIARVVNTHGDADHTYGNYLLKHAEIIASRVTAEVMSHVKPQDRATLKQRAPTMGEVGEFFLEIFADYNWDGCELYLPTRTFENELNLKVGDKDVQLVYVGPAHTAGDTLVYCPKDKVLFSGDILFVEGTPIMWAGPLQRWIDACNRILNLDVNVIVPGHGPVTDKKGVVAVRDYLTYVDREARKRFDAGMEVDDAVMDIPLGQYADWIDSERLVVNVHRLYDEYSGATEKKTSLELFALMASYRNKLRAKSHAEHVHAGTCNH